MRSIAKEEIEKSLIELLHKHVECNKESNSFCSKGMFTYIVVNFFLNEFLKDECTYPQIPWLIIGAYRDAAGGDLGKLAWEDSPINVILKRGMPKIDTDIFIKYIVEKEIRSLNEDR